MMQFVGNNKKDGNGRLFWIDIAKGILILLVVLHHLPYIYIDILEGDGTYLDALNQSSCLYVTWFMPAFFAITGYCSHFNVPFVDFLKKNILSILLPAILYGTLCYWGELILIKDFNWHHFIHIGGGSYWFLISLFFIKIWYWILYKNVKSPYIRLLVLLLLVIIGVYINNNGLFLSIRYLPHICIFSFFIFLGESIKVHNIIDRVDFVVSISFSFIIIVSYSYYMGWNLPYVTYRLIIQWEHLIPFFLLSISGIIVFFSIVNHCRRNRFLEWIGKNTITIYCLHILLLHIVEQFIGSYFLPDSSFHSACFVVLSMLVTIIFLSISIIIKTYVEHKMRTSGLIR